MPKVITKHTNEASKVPEPPDLEQGQLGVNIPDGKIYTKNSNNDIVLVAEKNNGSSGSSEFSFIEFSPTPDPTVEPNTYVMAMDEEGESPNKILTHYVKNELNEKIIIATTIV